MNNLPARHSGAYSLNCLMNRELYDEHGAEDLRKMKALVKQHRGIPLHRGTVLWYCIQFLFWLDKNNELKKDFTTRDVYNYIHGNKIEVDRTAINHQLNSLHVVGLLSRYEYADKSELWHTYCVENEVQMRGLEWFFSSSNLRSSGGVWKNYPNIGCDHTGFLFSEMKKSFTELIKEAL